VSISRPFLVAALLLAAVSLAGFAPRGSRASQPVQAAEAAPTPGQLAIVDGEGRTIGLCPLRHTDVSADVAGYVARVNVRQEFANPSKEPVEALYTFPLPADAAVDDMTMTIGKRVVRGQIKRREEARQIYEDARAAGKAAALLDQERPNIFTQSVANIMPGEPVSITVSYVHLLKQEEGTYEFAFPMVVGPRFVPGGGYSSPGQRGAPSPRAQIEGDPGSTSVVTDADRITPPITPPNTRAGHDIAVTVRIDAGMPVGEVKSALHEVEVRKEGETRSVVRLRGGKTIPNKDFILRYTLAGEELRTGVLAHAARSGDGYFTLILQPPAAPPQKDVSPKEMVFVIDQTGSQSGLPIRKAKETMRYCIENLNPGDTFQLIGFNTQIYPCFSAAVPVTPENVTQALRFLEPLEGNGGTDILKAVDHVLQMPTDPARPRIVCYMTDGYVGNDMQIIDYVKKHRGQTRMFPFGIGNSINRFLIEGMAREGRGAVEIVDLNMPGEKAAAKFYARVAKPLLLDVQVDWNGLPVVDVFPRHIPDVFTSTPIILKGRYTRGAAGEITVRGLLRGKPWSQTVQVSLPAVRVEGGAIPTLWAREKLEDLQAEDWVGAQTGRPNPKIKDQIVGLALDYRLMSQYTSFVAVEERIVNVGGKQRKVDVPVEMPDGVSYEGIFGDRLEMPETRARGAVSLYARMPKLQAPALSRALGTAGGAGAPGAPSGGSQPAPAAAAGKPANRPALLREEAKDEAEVPEVQMIARGTEEGRKRLQAMTPEQRRAVLARAKLAPVLIGLAERVKKDGSGGTLRVKGVPDVEKGRVEVQVWLNTLPKEGLAALKALGFELAGTLTKDRLLLGSIPVERLEKLIELEWIRRVEPPRYR